MERFRIKNDPVKIKNTGGEDRSGLG